MIKGGFGVVPYLPYHALYYHNSEKIMTKSKMKILQEYYYFEAIPTKR